jgi:hypothetical protein
MRTVEPAANDGTISPDLSTADAFLNAVEILPSIAHRALPIRLVVRHYRPKFIEPLNETIWS